MAEPLHLVAIISSDSLTVCSCMVTLQWLSVMCSCTRHWMDRYYQSSLLRWHIKPVKCPSVWCHFQNPKAPTLLGRHRWHLVYIFYGSQEKTSGKRNFEFRPVHCMGPPRTYPVVEPTWWINNQECIFKDTKETTKCRFGCKLLWSGIVDISPCAMRAPQT